MNTRNKVAKKDRQYWWNQSVNSKACRSRVTNRSQHSLGAARGNFICSIPKSLIESSWKTADRGQVAQCGLHIVHATLTLFLAQIKLWALLRADTHFSPAQADLALFYLSKPRTEAAINAFLRQLLIMNSRLSTGSLSSVFFFFFSINILQITRWKKPRLVSVLRAHILSVLSF